MSTVIEDQMRKAGMVLPSLNARIWRLLKDKPMQTSSTLAMTLRDSHKNISSVVGLLVKRKNVQATMVELRVASGNGPVMRKVAHYSALGEKWELLPMPLEFRKPKKKERLAVEAAKLAEGCAVGEVLTEQGALPSTPTPPAPSFTNIDHLTILEARKLYKQLHKMFGVL